MENQINGEVKTAHAQSRQLSFHNLTMCCFIAWYFIGQLIISHFAMDIMVFFSFSFNNAWPTDL